jgi:predicted anti-sigma-YlaC factor YlaD
MVEHMTPCSFDNLVKLLDKHLDLDAKLDVYDHLDNCDTCRDAIYHIKRDRDEAALLFRPFRARKLSAA